MADSLRLSILSTTIMCYCRQIVLGKKRKLFIQEWVISSLLVHLMKLSKTHLKRTIQHFLNK